MWSRVVDGAARRVQPCRRSAAGTVAGSTAARLGGLGGAVAPPGAGVSGTPGGLGVRMVSSALGALGGPSEAVEAVVDRLSGEGVLEGSPAALSVRVDVRVLPEEWDAVLEGAARGGEASHMGEAITTHWDALCMANDHPNALKQQLDSLAHTHAAVSSPGTRLMGVQLLRLAMLPGVLRVGPLFDAAWRHLSDGSGASGAGDAAAGKAAFEALLEHLSPPSSSPNDPCAVVFAATAAARQGFTDLACDALVEADGAAPDVFAVWTALRSTPGPDAARAAQLRAIVEGSGKFDDDPESLQLVRGPAAGE